MNPIDPKKPVPQFNIEDVTDPALVPDVPKPDELPPLGFDGATLSETAQTILDIIH